MHAPYADMEGFQRVVEIWERGDVWDISDKTHVYFIEENGMTIACMEEWLTSTNPAVTGFNKTDAGWLDNTKSKLSDWTVLINNRFESAEERLKESLTNYYGITDF